MAIATADLYDHIDPDIRDLCRALNATGIITTAWSCQGHPWRRLSPFHHGERPYLVFDASPHVAAVIHERIHRAVGEGDLHYMWRLSGAWLAVRDGDQRFWRLRWSLEPEGFLDARWFWRHSKVLADFAWMASELPGAISQLAEAKAPPIQVPRIELRRHRKSTMLKDAFLVSAFYILLTALLAWVLESVELSPVLQTIGTGLTVFSAVGACVMSISTLILCYLRVRSKSAA